MLAIATNNSSFKNFFPSCVKQHLFQRIGNLATYLVLLTSFDQERIIYPIHNFANNIQAFPLFQISLMQHLHTPSSTTTLRHSPTNPSICPRP
jgi:hypothetical protein